MQPQAAVDHQRDAGDERRGGRAQEHDRIRHVVDRREATERALLDRSVERRRAREAADALRAAGGTRRHAVHTNSIAAPLGRQRHRQRVDAGFRRGRVCLSDGAEVGECRADVDDRSAARLEMRKRRARHMERAFEIDVDDGPESVRRQILGEADEVAGGAVDHDVETAEIRDGLIDRRRYRAGIAHVGGSASARTPAAAISSAAGSRCSRRRLTMATSQPYLARARAIPRQIPVPPPVTSATRPFRTSDWNDHGAHCSASLRFSAWPSSPGRMSRRSRRLTRSTILANARATASSPEAGTTSGQS